MSIKRILVDEHENFLVKELLGRTMKKKEKKGTTMSGTVDKKITLIEFNTDSVYVQYDDMDSKTLSYNKAKDIFKELQHKIRYYTCESIKAIDFCNNISRRKYFVDGDAGTIEPRPHEFGLNKTGKKRRSNQRGGKCEY